MTATTEPLTVSSDQTPTSVPTLLEAIEIDQLIVIPGLTAILDHAAEFALDPDRESAVRQMLARHTRIVWTWKRRVADAVRADGPVPLSVTDVPGSLPVRGQTTIVQHARWLNDAASVAVIRAAFALVATASMTARVDDTDIASPRSVPDHRVLAAVLGRAVEVSADVRTLVEIYVSKASVFFSRADELRFGRASGEVPFGETSYLRYDPRLIAADCAVIGLSPAAIRISGSRF